MTEEKKLKFEMSDHSVKAIKVGWTEEAKPKVIHPEISIVGYQPLPLGKPIKSPVGKNKWSLHKIIHQFEQAGIPEPNKLDWQGSFLSVVYRTERSEIKLLADWDYNDFRFRSITGPLKSVQIDHCPDFETLLKRLKIFMDSKNDL